MAVAPKKGKLKKATISSKHMHELKVLGGIAAPETEVEGGK